MPVLTARHFAFCALFLSPIMLATTVADETKKEPVNQELSVGESAKVDVISKEKFNRTGVRVAAGQHFSIVVTEGAKWKDLSIVCDANGWLSKDAAPTFRTFIKKSEKNRRVPAANWFELVGTIGENEQHHFQIGLRGEEWTHTVKTDGELFLFANDLMKMYGNNHDSIEVTVTRQGEPGKKTLPKKTE